MEDYLVDFLISKSAGWATGHCSITSKDIDELALMGEKERTADPRYAKVTSCSGCAEELNWVIAHKERRRRKIRHNWLRAYLI